MQIFFKNVEGKHVTLIVEPTTLIKDIKLMIQDKEGYLPQEMRLYCHSTYLEDFTVKDYNIRNDSTIHVGFRVGPYIVLQTPSGKELNLNFGPGSSIINIKQDIQEKEGIPIDQQILILNI